MSVSLKPSEAVEGGGAIPVGKNLTVMASSYALFDYNGKAPTSVCLRQVLKDEENVEYTQYWSVGNPDRYTITQGGADIEGPPMNKSSNAFAYLENAVLAGFPENKIETAGSFVGTKSLFKAHTPKPFVDAQGVSKQGKAILVMEKVISLPGAKIATSAKKTTTTKTASAADAVSDEVKGEIIALVSWVLAQNGGEATKSKVASAVYAKDSPIAASKNKSTIGGLVFKPPFEGVIKELGFTLEGDTVKAA